MNFFCKGGFAMRGRSSQNIWILVLLMLAGVVLGGFIAKLVGGVSAPVSYTHLTLTTIEPV